jgi:hypothetical protein
MTARITETICAKNKLEHSLSQLSGVTGLTIEEVKETLGRATGLTPKDVGIIILMKQRGLTLEQISKETGVELEVLKQFMPEVIKETVETHALADQGKGFYAMSLERAHTLGSHDDSKTYSRSPSMTTEETKQPPKPQPTKTLPRP